MTPQYSPTPREELEMRLTALLLGQLPAEESAALQARIAAEPELATLHAQLAKATELLREATSLPEQPAPTAPVQFSPERRERLLAHFKTAKPTPKAAGKSTVIIDRKSRRDWSWMPLGLAASLVALVGVSFLAIATNGLVHRKAVVSREPLLELRQGTEADDPSKIIRSRPIAMNRAPDHFDFNTNEGRVLKETIALPPTPPSQQLDRSKFEPSIVQDTASVSLKDRGMKKLQEKYRIQDATPVPTVDLTKAIVSNGNLTASSSPTIVLPAINASTTAGLDSWGMIPEDQKQPMLGSDAPAPGGGGLALAQLLQNEFKRYPSQPTTTNLAPQFSGTIAGNLSLAPSPSSVAISGVVNAGSSTPPLTKTGTGSLILNGTNTFAGNTTVYGGTVSGTNGLSVGSAVTGTVVAPGFQSDSTLGDLNGQSQTTGTLSLRGANTYSGGTPVGTGTWVMPGKTQVAGTGGISITGSGPTVIGSTSGNTESPDIYFGGSSVLRPVPQAPQVPLVIAGGTFAANTPDSNFATANPNDAANSTQEFTIRAQYGVERKDTKVRLTKPYWMEDQKPSFGDTNSGLGLNVQDRSLTLNTEHGAGQITINGGGNLALNGVNSFGGILRDSERDGFANEDEWINGASNFPSVLTKREATKDAATDRSAGDSNQGQSAAAPAVTGLAGVFSDPQLQVVTRDPNRKKTNVPVIKDHPSHGLLIPYFSTDGARAGSSRGTVSGTVNGAIPDAPGASVTLGSGANQITINGGGTLALQDKQSEFTPPVIPQESDAFKTLGTAGAAAAPRATPPQGGETETSHRLSDMHLAKARNAALKGDNQTLEDELTAATEIWPRNPAMGEFSKYIFSQGTVRQKDVAADRPAINSNSASAASAAAGSAPKATPPQAGQNAFYGGGTEGYSDGPANLPFVAASDASRTPTTKYFSKVESMPGVKVNLPRTLEAAIAAGKAAMKDRDYEKATAYFKEASDFTANGPDAEAQHKQAVDQFSSAGYELAKQLITEGRYQQAQDTLTSVLDEHYDPRNKKAVVLLSHLEQPDYFNKEVTPKFRGNVEQVKQWFVEAQGFYDTGRLDLAKQRCEHILNVDPYNRAAREFEEKVERARDDYGIAQYNQTRAKQVADMDNAWAMPVRKFNVEKDLSTGTDGATPNTDAIRSKLERIVIPKLELREATIGEAIDFLKKKSVELDDKSPPGERGTNIVLKLPDAGVAGSAKSNAQNNLLDPRDVRMTVSLDNIPLIEALKYVTGLANLKFKVEPHAVSLVPLSEPTDVLVTREWTIPQDLIPRSPGAGGASANALAAPASAAKSGAKVDRESAKNWLIANGVSLNGAASAIYIEKSHRLIVRDTADQLDLVDQIIGANAQTDNPPKANEENVVETIPAPANVTEEALEKQRKLVKDLEAKARQIRADAWIVDPDPGKENSNLGHTASRMVDVHSEEAAQEIKVVELERQRELIKSLRPGELQDALKTLGIDDAVVAENMPLYQNALAEKTRLSNQGLSANDPKIKAQESKIAKYSKVLTGQLGVIKTTAENRLRFEQDKLHHLQKLAAEGKTVEAEENAKMTAYLDAKNKYLRAQKVLEGMEASPAAQETKEPPKEPAAASALIPQPEIPTRDNAFSTFSLNVSDVAFKLAAATLEQGHMPDPSTVRSEEFINAFDYRDPEPVPGAPLAFASDRARDPFAQNRDLLRFSVKTAAAGRQPDHPLNIVLLLDKSGSMERADRVNIVREALRVLAAQLQPQDRLSIVTFARTPHLWADGVAGDKAGDLVAKVSDITPEGGTNLEAALDLGYETALRHYAVTSINRVVLFTDGAANLGDVDPEVLTKKVEAKRKQGVALDCFGIGWEGYNDDLLEQLTRNGDGRYGFINTPEDAKTNFAAQLAGALQVAASDVKVQVEFNPRRVTAWRQIGYAKHQLTKEQFRDNSVAAAQIGAEESGNALYVVAVDPKGEGDLATVHVRYRVPGTSDYREHEWVVSFTGQVPPLEKGSPALRLAGSAAAFSEMLAASPYAAEVTSDRLLSLLDGVPAVYGNDPHPQQLVRMIQQARSLSGR